MRLTPTTTWETLAQLTAIDDCERQSQTLGIQFQKTPIEARDLMAEVEAAAQGKARR